MPSGVKRYGIEIEGDLDLELRLRRIEALLAQCRKISDIGDAEDDTILTDVVPQVTGLRVTGKTVGTISFAWNQVSISDLRRYELWVAEDLAFSENIQKFNLLTNTYSFNTIALVSGGGGTTIYAKVRARTRSNKVGAFSTVLSTTVGQIQTDDIVDGAVDVQKIVTDPGVGVVIWTAINDGPGSGLDADTVDGYHATDMSGSISTFSLNDYYSGYYEEHESTDISSNSWSTAHTIGAMPRMAQFWLECINGEYEFSTGDRIFLGASINYSGSHGLMPWINDTNLGYAWVLTRNVGLIRKSTATYVQITKTKWKFVAQLWK